MKISSSGKNLHVVISNKATISHEWLTFASWYSFFKNAPDANISFASQRSSNQMHQLFNWANRLPIQYTYYNYVDKNCQYINKLFSLKKIINKGFTKVPVLCIEPDITLTEPLNTEHLNNFLEKKQCIKSDNNKVWFISEYQFILDAIDNHFLKNTFSMPSCSKLCVDAKDSPNPIVSLEKGCGRFVTTKWIDRKGCPFGKANRFYTDTLTVNEKRILNLWKKLAPLYKAVF